MSTNLSAAEEAVATLGEEMKSQGEQYLRLKADFDNFRKRTVSVVGLSCTQIVLNIKMDSYVPYCFLLVGSASRCNYHTKDW